MKPLAIPNGSRVQSVVFPADQWTATEARSWLLKHKGDFKAPPVERYGGMLRYRQEDPKKFSSFGYLTRYSGKKRILFLVGGHRKPKTAAKKTATKTPAKRKARR